MGFRIRAKGLDKLHAVARQLGDPARALRAASSAACETTLNLISKGFKSGTDPYGSAWDAPNNLQITGALRRYAKSNVSEKGWRVHSTDEKAAWHHAPQPREAWGGRALPTRIQVPTPDRGLPANWAKAIGRAFKEALLDAIGHR